MNDTAVHPAYNGSLSGWKPNLRVHGGWVGEDVGQWPAIASTSPLPQRLPALSLSKGAVCTKGGSGEAAIGHREGLQPPGGLAE